MLSFLGIQLFELCIRAVTFVSHAQLSVVRLVGPLDPFIVLSQVHASIAYDL